MNGKQFIELETPEEVLAVREKAASIAAVAVSGRSDGVHYALRQVIPVVERYLLEGEV